MIPALVCSLFVMGCFGSERANGPDVFREDGFAGDQIAQKPCKSQAQKCCFKPNGDPVVPGTKRGPYTCLPNGTWG